MNNKGFTLVELLAVVLLLSLVGGIATLGVLGIINNSKIKGENILKDKIKQSIETSINYLSINGNKINGIAISETGSTIKFKKCDFYLEDGTCNNNFLKDATAKKIKPKNSSNYFKLNDIILNTKTFDSNKIVNPSTKKELKNLDDINVYLFKDSDYVYYYYLDLNQGITNKDNYNIKYTSNSVVTNMQESLCEKISSICSKDKL